MTPRTIDDVIRALPRPAVPPLPAPPCAGGDGPRLMFAVASMASHTSDENAQLQDGLEHAGYELAGWALDTFDAGGHSMSSITDVRRALAFARPGTVLMADKRESEGRTAGPGHDPRERFTNAGALRDWPAFRGTILKDAQNDPAYHRASAEEIGAHFHVTPYHPRIVAHFAPYTRLEHLVRYWHTVDPAAVPPFTASGREGCILSGAVSRVYPLRSRLISNVGALYGTTYLPHPGYRRDGCRTPEFLRTLSRFKVAICTSSMFGYALRKLVEAVACGCVVITDLPTNDVLPEIDSALIRVHPSITLREISEIIKQECARYDGERQAHFARLALARFDWRVEGVRLAGAIEELRRAYRP